MQGYIYQAEYPVECAVLTAFPTIFLDDFGHQKGG
jgi:hypothetical protein